jgi:hypothetical protein
MVATPSRLPVKAASVSQVSGNPVPALAGSTSIYKGTGRQTRRQDDRNVLVKPWQREAYRHVNICGEARYAVTLFANMAARAEIGISEGSALGRKAVWVNDGPEVALLAELCPTVRERKKLIRDFMTHYVIAGECYLISREMRDTDPGYETHPTGFVWEIVGVLELQKNALGWQVKHDNDDWIDLDPNDPVIRMWNPDPENRREAWSPMRSLLPTLKEIEWYTAHIFTQVRTRLISAGVWFLPNNMTYPAPPPEMIEGGTEAMATMNEAELFMVTLAGSAIDVLGGDEVSFPTVVLADPSALEQIDQAKLIKFWSEIDDKAMTLRSDSVRRFALGWDLPPEQVLGASGLAVTGAGGSAGSVNHWGVWANEEQTISAHIEPALDNFVGVITVAVLRIAIENSTRVVGYDTATLRLRQDRSKESIELYDRGELKGEVMLRENGFDPEHDRMDEAEWKRWMLTTLAKGSPSPEQMNESLRLLGIVLNVPETSQIESPGQRPGTAEPRNLDDHPYEGPPREQHDHSPAPFTALHASAEALVLRALEKAGNRLLNDGKRGRSRDRSTPAHLAHLTATLETPPKPSDFDFSMLSTMLGDLPAGRQARIGGALTRFCVKLYAEGEGYTRDGLIDAIKGL